MKRSIFDAGEVKLSNFDVGGEKRSIFDVGGLKLSIFDVGGLKLSIFDVGGDRPSIFDVGEHFWRLENYSILERYLYPHPAQIHRARYCDTGIFLEVSNCYAGNCKVETIRQQFTGPA